MIKSASKQTLKSLLGEPRYHDIQQQWRDFKGQLKNRWMYFYYTYIAKDKNHGYDRAFYENIENFNTECYDLLARTIVAEFNPKKLVDVGCGSGGISLALMKAGCGEIVAFDYSLDAVKMARSKGLPSVEQIDLTQAETIPARGDVCICLEVAEHLPESAASKLCQLLSEAAPNLVFTAAPPGQGGHLHLNEQPQSYWIELMRSFSMTYDPEAVARMRQSFDGKMIRDYDDNLMIFRRSS
ncbi:class I SAM-dependent methyltransferase [Oxynema aestuarii]|jgi:SAM-dependent methyltransferase|uniref:Class I SAM-dependent methyltransferase n=1 Tax=Oxynema aestuarii AP17 TaxID=2064643 RepID=A0A6H1TSI8_9CYAN|nr:class I SAM-dependent methyltransferase [Oxynema aestuarii]QIZ69176.1 class I SAM-dependent methyltransferase [Oxynema aestuarii AP17]RMH77368.1 MAG: class I SAM-dependent methyltransferase [Cyanobacteria bacterium J007]